jgi:hypothetical protein
MLVVMRGAGADAVDEMAWFVVWWIESGEVERLRQRGFTGQQDCAVNLTNTIESINGLRLRLIGQAACTDRDAGKPAARHCSVPGREQ